MSVRDTHVALACIDEWVATRDPAARYYLTVSPDGARVSNVEGDALATASPDTAGLDDVRTALHALIGSAGPTDRWGLTIDLGGLSLGRIKTR
jgi:hypothetical protein